MSILIRFCLRKGGKVMRKLLKRFFGLVSCLGATQDR